MFFPCTNVEDCKKKAVTTSQLGIGPAILYKVGAPQASLVLTNSLSDNSLCYTLDSVEWTLENSGQYVEEENRVKWEVKATKTEVPAFPTLKVNGVLSITNSGGGAADVGNIVINLQRKNISGQFQTFASDIADATNGDLYNADSTCSGQKIAYVVQKIGPASAVIAYLEGPLSGPLTFWNEDGNSIFSIQGGWTIGAGETKSLLYQASFFINDPSLTDLRVETYITFGNAGGRGGSGASANDVKYKGDCVAYNNVRSVPFRKSMLVPALKVCNETVTLRSLESDVTGNPGGFTGYTTNIGNSDGVEQLSGSVVRHIEITPDPSVDPLERKYSACAHLTSPGDFNIITITLPDLSQKQYRFECCPALSLDACSEVVIPGESQPCGCDNDGYITYTQGGWGSSPSGNNPGMLLFNNFSTVYPSGFVRIGNPSGSFYADFYSSLAIQNFLPAGGTAARLTANLVDPTTTSAGVFAGQVLALTLNVDFSNAGVTYPPLLDNKMLGGTRTYSSMTFTTSQISQEGVKLSSGTLSDLVIIFNGKTVGEFLAICNGVLGGGAIPGWLSDQGVTLSDLNALATALNEAFDNGNKGPLSKYLCNDGQVPCF